MFGRRKSDEDPFAALKDGATYQSTPTTVPDVGRPRVRTAPPRPPSAAHRDPAQNVAPIAARR